MSEVVQVHAFIPRSLKRETFSELALQEKKFSHWLKEQMEVWLQEVEGQKSGATPDEKANHACP